MYKKAEIFYLYSISSLHAGSGDSLGIVDMPIQRERHTDYPKIEGSSLKGALRENFEQYLLVENEQYKTIPLTKEKLSHFFNNNMNEIWKDIDNNNKLDEDKNNKIIFNKAISILFGSDDVKSAYAGSLGFTDARLLFFPVKSIKGIFAWITCPFVINRFIEDMKLAEKNIKELNSLDSISINENECIITEKSKLSFHDNIILEEYSFVNNKNKDAANILAKFIKEDTNKNISERLAIVSDNNFKDFVTLSTEVLTRTKIDNKTGTVTGGALFTEEYLPSETIMYSIALASKVFINEKNNTKIKNENDVLAFFRKGIPEIIQIGGNSNIGKGICEIIIP